MRSQTPKLLHPICGRPMIAWPVAAASEAGAAKVVVVEAPEPAALERRSRRRPARVRRPGAAARDRRRGPGGRRAASTAPDTVIVLNGDHPLVSAGTIRELAEAHAALGRGGDDRDGGARGPDRLWPGGARRPTGRSSGSSRPRRRATRPSSSSTSARSTPASSRSTGGSCSSALAAGHAATTPRASATCPTCCRSCARTSARSLAYEIADLGATIGINDRVALARRPVPSRSARIHERHMLAGVDDRRPGRDRDRRRRARSAPDAVIAPFTSLHGSTTIGAGARSARWQHADRHAGRRAARRSSTPTSNGRRDRRPGQRRAVRLPAARDDPARGLQGGHVRRDQELGHRRRIEGPAPVIHRRRRHRRGHEPRRGHDHRQLRRLPQAPHDDRLDASRRASTRCFVAPVTRRRRRLHRRRLGDHQGRAAGRARRSPARASDEHRGVRRTSQGAGSRRRGDRSAEERTMTARGWRPNGRSARAEQTVSPRT